MSTGESASTHYLMAELERAVLCRSKKVDAPDGDGGLEERNQQRLQQEKVERGRFRGSGREGRGGA